MTNSKSVFGHTMTSTKFEFQKHIMHSTQQITRSFNEMLESQQDS